MLNAFVAAALRRTRRTKNYPHDKVDHRRHDEAGYTSLNVLG
jgi:hypothetical protein